MKFKLLLLLSFSLISCHFAAGQYETYSVQKATFSSDNYDEFSPVFYKNGIIFCSNRNQGIAKYSTTDDKGLFKIYFIDTLGKKNWQSSKLFSKYLTTNLNDGPATFSRTGDTIVYSRNLEINNSMRDISSPRNKLGLFTAILVDGKWTKIRELRFNNEWYNVTTPCLSSDNKKLYFASDKPGGFGGYDLYYSLWKSDYWGEPVNMGPIINTKGNEAYPFINPSGELFFSSDGHSGLGGKDIFYSRFSDSTWLKPVPLDPPINSEYDDFGIITDSLISSGYFASNRDKSVDIFRFTTNFPQIFYSTVQKENQYCFIFSDSGEIVVDTMKLKYIWDFGDGQKASGENITHCYPGPGKYKVKLDIFDKATGNLFFSKLEYDLELRDFEQPFITSPDIVVKGDLIQFNGSESNLPGYKILNYSWDFGDGTKLQGVSADHAFSKSGISQVNLGVTLKSLTNGNIHNTGVTKLIIVKENQSEKSDLLATMVKNKAGLINIKSYSNAFLKTLYSAESDFKADALFLIELVSSKTRIDMNSSIFKNVSSKYEVREFFDKDAEMYSYIVDQQIDLMSTYIGYKEIRSKGYNEAKIKIEVLKDPAEKELNSLKKIFGTLTDTFIDRNNRLTSSAYLLLDQISKVMNKYPAVRLEIEVHTDNTGLPESKIALSQYLAQIIANYLHEKGIESKRLIARGLGGSRPVAVNLTEKGKMLNRRVDFIIIGE